ncbi:MAG TPA: hypothetical protein DEQ43_01495, partial [Nocardioides bacterium]|nr:hypothetical protein [Nocardioides sp.]
LTARDHDDSYSTMCHVDTTALAQGLLTVTQWSNQDLRSRPASAGAADWELIAESLEPYAPALIYGDLSRHSPSAAAWMPLARMLSLVARATGAPVFLGWPGHGIRPAPQGRADRLSAVVEAAARDHEREVVTRRRAQGRGLARPPRLDEPR